jgi:hypothetical protein
MDPGFRRDDEFFARNATPEELCLVHPIALPDRKVRLV